MTTQTKSNNFFYLIDPRFTKVNRLLVLSFENEDDRFSFAKYDTQKFGLNDFNVLIDAKSFFDVPVKKQRKTYEKNYWNEKNNDYTTGNLFNHEYF